MQDKNKGKRKKWRYFGTTSILMTFILIARLIYVRNSPGFSEKDLMLGSLLSILPALLCLIVFSISTKQTFAKGYRVAKGDNPGLYFLMVMFWVLILFLDLLLYVGIKFDYIFIK